MSAVDWPEARLTPVGRARALAAALPGAGHAEVLVAVPYAEAWSRLMDLERSVPASDPHVHALTVWARQRNGDGSEQLIVTSSGPLGRHQTFDVRVEDGLCLMRERRRLFVVVMAAEPVAGDPGRTRYVHVEAVPRRAATVLRPVMQRIVEGDVRGFRAHLEG